MSKYVKGKLELHRGRNRHYNPESVCFGSYELTNQTCFYICGPKNSSDFVADIIVGQTPTGKATANELIHRWNSQPDLLQACEELIENEPFGITPYFDKALRKVEAAIAKAKP